MKKAALHNLGCKVNAYETEAMQELLEKNGYEIVPFHDQYLLGDEYGRSQVQTDDPSCPKTES